MLEILLERFSKPYPKNSFGDRNYYRYEKNTAEFDRIHNPIKIEVGYLPPKDKKSDQ